MRRSDVDDRYAQAREALQRHWGYDDFRKGQQSVIRAAVANRDVLAVLPTGGGKSICYQVPSVIESGITIVVSPLIALMQDQVEGLRRAGVRAAFMNSTLSWRQVDQCWTDLKFGLYRLLYVAPERLMSESFIERARDLQIARVAVDEAHCISEWGHSFRPSYLRIAEFVEAIGRPPVLALTATATPRVRDDIRTSLRLRDPEVIVAGFDRPNIVWTVFHDENKKQRLKRVLDGVGGSGIVYAATRRSTETWADWLRSEGVTSRAYHAGLSPDQRTEVQNAWLHGDIRVVTATNAFGMGIDKPDVRFVVHVQIPASLEAYYQEAGRGGRDGHRSHAVLVFHPSDLNVQERLIRTAHPSRELVAKVYDAVCSMAGIAVGSEAEDLLVVNRAALMRAIDATNAQVERAIDILENEGAWRRVLVDQNAGLFRFKVSAATLKEAADRKGGAYARFVDAVLRSIDATAFSSWSTVHPQSIARASGLTEAKVEAGLAFLASRDYCAWLPVRDAVLLDLIGVRSRRPGVDARSIERSRESSQRKLTEMQQYANGTSCRRKHLLAYFGEKSEGNCGRCDNCLGRHEAVVVTPRDEPDLLRILSHVREHGDPPSAQSEREIALVRWLNSEGYLSTDEAEPWKYAVSDRGFRYLK